MSNFSIDGLATGLNTTEIISQLMAVERAPVRLMQAKVTTFNAQAAAWKDLNTRLSSLAKAAGELVTASRLALFSASSSSPAVTATASSGAAAGSLTVRVQSLATAHQVATAGVAGPTAVIGAGTATLGSGLPALGLTAAAADGDLTPGTHSVVVTRASAAAAVTGLVPTGPVTVADGANQLELVVNGQARTVTVAAGTYQTPEALAAAVSAAAGSGLTAVASDGALVLRTTAEGSAATLQLTGGNGAAALGFTAGGTVTGADGAVSVDGVASAPVTWVEPGTTLTLASTAGTLSVTVGAGLREGSGTVTVLRSGGGATLASLASDLKAANPALTTALVDTGSGATPTRLVVGAKDTGAAAAFTLDLAGYTGMAGTTQTLVQGRDAVVRLGSLTVQRPTNTVSDLMPGVTLQLAAAAPDADVTVTVARDDAAIAAKLSAVVDAVNGLLTRVAELTKYDATAKKGSVLTGDSRARDLVATIQTALQSAGAGSLSSLSQIGVSFQRGGTYALDQAKLKAAMAADFDGVAALLSRTGTAVPADPRIAFVGAEGVTQGRATPYPVVVTQAAATAALTGAVFGTLGAEDALTVTVGSRSASWTAPAGATPAEVAAGLNQAFAQNGVAAAAVVVDGAVRLETTAYGSAATLTVTGGAGTGLTGTASGTDVAGTIDGVAATGKGQVLTSVAGASDGLSLRVTADGNAVAAAAGALAFGVRYSPGVVGALFSTVARLTSSRGLITTAQSTAESSSRDLGARIDNMEQRLVSTEERYVRQFARLETVISQLRSQSSWLASQIGAMPQLGSSS